jgi:hypothetical protein
MTDEELKAMTIEQRNEYLDEYAFNENEAQNEYDPDEAYERWLENGGAAADLIAYENERERWLEGFPW